MMKTIYKSTSMLLCKRILVLVMFLSMLGINESRASHATGADLTYTFLGNGQYLVTFTFYRDCFGIDAPTSQTLTVSSFSCNFSQTYTMNPLPNTGQEITYNCTTATSTCQGGSFTGVQQYQYTTTVTLPAPCSDWQFSTSVSSRNAAVTTIQNPDFNDLYIDAFLNNTVEDNSSPTFSNVPIAFECIGQPNFFNHGVIDADGDSLVYSFIAPRSDPNTPLTYNPGYSVSSPISSSPGVSINSITGDILMNPTQPEVASIAVLILEYRDGVIIGSVMRDMQIYIVACTNTLPTVTGINGTTDFQTSSCVGGQLCFDIFGGDVDPGDSLFMTWNNGIPQASFTVTGGAQPTGHFCWAPTSADARPQPYTFTVTVRDNACPSNGIGLASFSVTVSNMSVQLTSTPSVQCNGSHNGSASAIATGNPPLQYVWTTPTGILSANPISHLTGGNYTLNVIDGNGCVGTQNFTIINPAPIVVSVTPTNAGCGGSLGSAMANVTGGTPNPDYSYLWTPGNSTSQNATGLTTGQYTVRVTDSHGCSQTGSTSVQSSTPVDFTLHVTGATCVANDGAASVTHTGGTGSYSYVWTPDFAGDTTSASLSNLITGGISVVATDLGTGCAETLTGIIPNLAGVTATITSSSDATCESGEDGSATVVASGGQPPYIYLWPNGDTTATTNHLAPGTYLAMVEDYNGCRAYASVTIGFQFAAPHVDLGPDTMPCTGTPMTLDAGPGFSSYLWSDNSTGQTYTTNTSGPVSVFVTNANGCQGFDAVDVQFVTCMVVNPGTGHTNTAPSAMTVYPNPANNEVNVSIARLRDARVKVTISDILGNSLYSSNEVSQYGYSKKLDIHTYPAGVYLLKVEYNDEVTTTRIVKQ